MAQFNYGGPYRSSPLVIDNDHGTSGSSRSAYRRAHSNHLAVSLLESIGQLHFSTFS